MADSVTMTPDKDGIIPVPAEATSKPHPATQPGSVVFVGADPGGTVRRVTKPLHFVVSGTAATDGGNTGGPGAPSVVEQLVGRVDGALEELALRVERGDFDGVSPTAATKRIEGGALLTVTDGSGTTESVLLDGRPGKDAQPYDDTEIREGLGALKRDLVQVEVGAVNAKKVQTFSDTERIQARSNAGIHVLTQAEYDSITDHGNDLYIIVEE